MLPDNLRLKKERDIKETLKRKQYTHKSPLLRFVAKDSPAGNSRMAVVTPKSLGTAVKRNRIRRVFKAAFSQIKSKANIDLVLFPMSKAVDKSKPEIRAEIEQGLLKYGLL